MNWQARMAGHLDLMADNIAVVTPRVEASPDRSDFAKLGETIAASLVQAQEHANHASVLLEQTKKFADDIRS